jgi:Tol biopolymer transport system component
MRVVTRILDVSTWPRLVRNSAGVAWVAGLLFVAIVVWRAPQRAYHAVICSSAQVGSPSWSPDGRQIVFAREGACSSALYVMHRDGSGVRRLAESRNDDELPAWSPDGRSIVLVGTHSIDTIRPDGTGRRLLSHDDSSFGLAWSPDGTRLAYTHGSFVTLDDDQLQTSLVILRADGTLVRRVLGHTLGLGTPAWSSDGNRLAVAGEDGLYVMDVDGGHRRRIWQQYFSTAPPAPAWSPDDRTISFVDRAGLELIDVPVPRLRQRISITGAADADASSWTPTGGWIAFSIAGGQRPGIYLVRPDGRALHRIAAL